MSNDTFFQFSVNFEVIPINAIKILSKNNQLTTGCGPPAKIIRGIENVILEEIQVAKEHYLAPSMQMLSM